MAPRRKQSGANRKQQTKHEHAPTPNWRKHCHCKQDQSSSWTVTCANCDKWYHGDCISFPQHLQNRIQKLICRRCEKMFGITSSFYPKCRLESCERAAQSDSEYCCLDHRTEFWRKAVEKLRNTPEKNVKILKWLAKRCDDNHNAFILATPRNLPKPRKQPNTELEVQKQRLEDAIAFREANNICGFRLSLLDPKSPNGNPEPCQGDIKLCARHKNWPEVTMKRIKLDNLTPEERTEPDPEWLAKRAKFLVAGTTRYSRRKGWKGAYFIPYVWEDDNEDFFLDNNPEPFWDKHF